MSNKKNRANDIIKRKVDTTKEGVNYYKKVEQQKSKINKAT